MKIIILYNQALSNNPDELDVIDQKNLVVKACENLKYEVKCLTVGNDLMADIEAVKKENPDVVFNLVEETFGKGELIYFAPAILNALKIPYTGVPLDALFLTTNKVLAKKIMQFNNLPTADFYAINEFEKLNPTKTYIAKPIWEEASVGITEDYIFNTSEIEKNRKIKLLSNTHYFIEEFIDGREINISMLAANNEVEVLPPAEIIFSEFFNDKPKIVGYAAKWDENSEEYKQTNRFFETLENTPNLKEKLITICKQTWTVFNLKGYARVDFRVDATNNIFILEINGNPCISPDSGFIAALNIAGYTKETMVKRIIEDIN
ncbi:ATP-grasp domain-containing protein [uncultured Lutibacter sp.]|uniref:D-alanine--D-alanine ligase family protein n=1 Tax=uncultured Lutibacter sp. TaxID=437739 RepID=UPI00262378E8|nr:ATP-grasp domain-containing protein [uncultured Lutibacter sp.]